MLASLGGYDASVLRNGRLGKASLPCTAYNKPAAFLPRACFSLPNYFHPVIAAGDTRIASPNASSTRITVAIVGLPPGANAR